VEEPIAIAPLKRYLADLHREAVFRVSSGPERPEQVAVVGGGPAGLMCAYELRKMGYPVTIFEAEDALGGALHLYIPPYRLPRQVLDHETSLVKKLGAEVRLNTRIGRDVSWDDLRRRFQAIFVATGAHQSLPLRVPGEELEGVIAALSFLKAVNKREPVPMGREVAVIGGGNVAVDAARQARRLGSDRVTIICLETLDEMPALPLEVNEARAEGIEFLHRWGVKRLLGEDGKVAGLELKVVVQVFDDQGRFAPTYDETSLSNRPADMVITAVGLTAACDYLTTDNPPLPRPAASKWTTRPWVLSVPEFSPVEI
jgi:NADPH-dependent glutamate synthase beta subunit-like oxidoreductase